MWGGLKMARCRTRNDQRVNASVCKSLKERCQSENCSRDIINWCLVKGRSLTRFGSNFVIDFIVAAGFAGIVGRQTLVWTFWQTGGE